MQKFHRDDHVKIAADLGPSMSHFKSDCEAIVIGSYADQYGGSDTKSYTLYVKGSGRTSWYEEDQLTLIAANQAELLAAWEKDKTDEDTLHGDIDWIFANGETVLKKMYGASISTLAACFGLTNLWGSRGEGVTYQHNAIATISLAMPFLKTSDKAGYLEVCSVMKNEMAKRNSDRPSMDQVR